MSASMDVAVVCTGTANLASILAGLRRAGAEPRLTQAAEEVAGAERLVMPGVGSFGAAMGRLMDQGLIEPLRARLRAGKPTLCVCVGLQLLCEASEESPGTLGLGVVPAVVRRFGGGVRVPQLGWNEVQPGEGCRVLSAGHAYFANSYRLTDPPPAWAVAWADHGGRFVAAMERGRVLACQFHPELSGAWGLALLERWCRGEEAPC